MDEFLEHTGFRTARGRGKKGTLCHPPPHFHFAKVGINGSSVECIFRSGSMSLEVASRIRFSSV